MQKTKQAKSGVVLGLLALAGVSLWGCSSEEGDPVGGELAGTGAVGGSGGSMNGKGGSFVVMGGRSAGGTTSSGGSFNPAGGTNASSGGSGGSDVCVAASKESAKAVVALYFMVDISGSMKCEVPEPDPENPCETDPNGNYADRNRWTDSSTALKNFFTAPASSGLWAGTQFFPTGDMCESDTYADADSEIAALPAAAEDLVDSIDAQRPGGMTPTVPSLLGAVRHAADWAETHPDQQAVVVYLTDGYPRGCDGESNDIGTATEVAQDAFEEDGIRTYVLGVGSNLVDLDRIAAAGGTQRAFFVDTGADVTAQLTAALGSIREDVTVDCTYTIPEPPAGESLDLERVNVEYTNGDGEKVQVGYNGTNGTCEDGWHFAENNTQVVLCGSTCEEVKADPEARIDVAFGCMRMPFEPR